jgi:hypothetical protein
MIVVIEFLVFLGKLKPQRYEKRFFNYQKNNWFFNMDWLTNISLYFKEDFRKLF